MLGGVDIIAFVPTMDSAKARAFYEGVLGLRFVKDDGFALVLDANGIMVRVAKMKEFVPALSRSSAGRCPISKMLFAAFRKEESSSRSSDSSTRTNWGSGLHLPETKLCGSRIPTGIYSRPRNTCEKGLCSRVKGN